MYFIHWLNNQARLLLFLQINKEAHASLFFIEDVDSLVVMPNDALAAFFYALIVDIVLSSLRFDHLGIS